MDDFRSRLAETLGARNPTRIRVDDARDAAVLIPIYAAEEPTLIFTLRTDTLPSHKGQISFPGGSMDPGDETPSVLNKLTELGHEPVDDESGYNFPRLGFGLYVPLEHIEAVSIYKRGYYDPIKRCG